jgi:hypothetical protein
MSSWALSTRLAFRFGFAFGALLVWPFPLGLVPQTDWLGERAARPLVLLDEWVATAIFGLPAPPSEPTGSGDTAIAFVALLVAALLAALVAAAWSIVDRRRAAYPRLAAGARVVLRYWLGAALLTYGFAKLIPTQMAAPDAIRLDERVGEMSPMGMLWTFVGSSTPYQMFAGAGEVIAGALLLSRRTATLGALLAIAVLTHVVALNFCFDVPVKLYASQLLVAAVLVALPDLRRVMLAVLGRDVPPAPPPRPRTTVARERLRVAGKVAAIAAIAIGLYVQVDGARDDARGAFGELEGTWTVEAFTGAARWRVLLVGKYLMQIRYDDDHREDAGAEVDAAAHVLAVRTETSETTWRYQLRDASHLVIDGDHLHVELARAPDPPLATRGFHWIQEVPVNR